MRAWGVDYGSAAVLGIGDLDDYEVFRMLHIEADGEAFFLNVGRDEQPVRANRVSLKFGRRPEEVRVSALPPRQRDFFRTRLPSIYERFRGHRNPKC